MLPGRRLVTAVITSGVLAATLAACGSDEPSTTADPSPSESSGESTPSADPSSDQEPDGGTTTTLDPASQEFIDRLKAGMGEEGSVHVELTMSGPVKASAQGDTTYGPDGSEMRLSMRMSNLPGGEMEMVLVDDKAYLSMPGVTEPGTFFEVDESNPAMAGLSQGLSPADSFDAFEAGLTGVEEVGAEEVRGEPTTHYRLEVDAEAALEATGQGSVPGLPDTLGYDVWLDDEDRMRRLTYELAGTELTMDMLNWGEDVTIEAPTGDELVEAPSGM